MALLVRLAWEGLLLIGVVVVIGLTLADETGRDMLTHHATSPLGQVGIVGLLALGLSLSLRVGAVNLAVGSLASVSGIVFGKLSTSVQMPMLPALLLVLAGAAGVGLLIAVAVAALRIPAWAVSLAVALLLSIVAGAVTSADIVRVDGPQPQSWALPLAVVLAVGSIVVGGLMWTPPGSAVAGRARRVADTGPSGGWDGSGAVVLAGAVVLSSMLAAGAGVVAVLDYRATTAASALGVEFLSWALIPVLIAGASLRSPRGAIAGIALGCTLQIYGQLMFTVRDAPTWLASVALAGLALVGLIVGRGLDAVAERVTGSPQGQPEPVPPPDPEPIGAPPHP